MTSDETDRKRVFRNLHVESKTRDDGRYLLYYSWPATASESTDSSWSNRPAADVQQPWTPEAGPPDENPRV
jgi:hypothetical protein